MIQITAILLAQRIKLTLLEQ